MITKAQLGKAEEINDFGFTLVGEDEITPSATVIQKTVADTEEKHKANLEVLYQMVLPLLKNLAVDSGKDYIFWPKRVEEMNKFIKKVDSFMEEHS